MAITLRSGKELQKIKEDEKMTKKVKQAETEEETKMDSLETTEKIRKLKVKQEQPVEEGDLKNKEEVQAYKPPIPLP